MPSFDDFNFLLRVLSSFPAFRFGVDLDGASDIGGVEAFASRTDRLDCDVEAPLYAKWDIEARKADEEERLPDM